MPRHVLAQAQYTEAIYLSIYLDIFISSYYNSLPGYHTLISGIWIG